MSPSASRPRAKTCAVDLGQQALIAFARGVTRARAGTPGTDSVNTFRSHTVLGHNHFRLRHRSFGRSGPTCTSRGPVATQPFERVERSPHSQGRSPPTPGRSTPRPVGCRLRGAAPTRRPHRRDRAAVNYLQRCPRFLVLNASRTPSSQGRGPQINPPTRHHVGQHQTPKKCEELACRYRCEDSCRVR